MKFKKLILYVLLLTYFCKSIYSYDFVLKEIHLANQKNRDASVKFISLTREPEPTFQYNKKSCCVTKLFNASS